MSSMTNYISKALVLLILLVPLSSWSQRELLAIGQIEDLGSNFISITDTRFSTLSTVKVFLINGKPGSLADLKEGDFVKLTLLKINKNQYVDIINILPEL